MRKLNLENLSKKEQGYLVGLFLGDGYAYYHKKERHYAVEFFLHSIRDQDIQNRLLLLLKKINLVCTVFKDPRYYVNRIRTSSKLFYKYLNLFEQNIFLIKRLGKEFSLGFLSGIIDAEGSTTHGSILVAQKDDALANFIKNTCMRLGVDCRIWRSPNPKSDYIWRLRISTRFKYLQHSSEKVRRRELSAFP